MTERIVERYQAAPSAPRFMARAFRRSRGLSAKSTIPRIEVEWTGWRLEPAQLDAFRLSTGLDAHEGMPVLFPQVVGFRLQMALLTHPAYPLPVWSVLQVRNRLVRHLHIDSGEKLDMRICVDEQRIVEKGIEVDLISRVMRGLTCCWEGRTTFFHRGRFGAPDPVQQRVALPDLSQAPTIARFSTPAGGGWDFGKLTGDYNGIHCWNWYARRLGFPRAFSHSQRAAAMCQARLAGPDTEAQTLDLWIRGPVFYGAGVQLNGVSARDGLRFGLSLHGDARSALVGYWRPGADAV
jgi:hypothetical protein